MTKEYQITSITQEGDLKITKITAADTRIVYELFRETNKTDRIINLKSVKKEDY